MGDWPNSDLNQAAKFFGCKNILILCNHGTHTGAMKNTPKVLPKEQRFFNLHHFPSLQSVGSCLKLGFF